MDGEADMRDFLKRIARQPLMVKVTDGLGVRGLLRGVYRWGFAPEGGKHQVAVGGRTAKFHVYSQATVEALDSLGGERPMLEFLMARLAPGDCFYDIGAATGLYAIFLALGVGEQGCGVAFEPERDSYGRLLDNLKLNKLNNVQAFRVALGDHDGSAILQTAEVAGAGRIVSAGGGETHVPEEHVDIVQGDSFREKHSLRVPKAIKIDVEGLEYSVVQGLSRVLSQPSCELVCCEIHPRFLPESCSSDDVLAFLRFKGFSEIAIHPRGDDLHAFASKPKCLKRVSPPAPNVDCL